MPSESRTSRVVVYQHRLDPHIFREILADELDLNRTDAMRLVAQAPGILDWPLTRRRALRLARLLASVGVQVGVWPVNRLPSLGNPTVVHRVSCQVEGLAAFGARAEPTHWMPWAYVEVISVGEFPGRTKDQSALGASWFDASVGAVRSLVLGRRRPGLSARKIVPRSSPELWVVRRRPTQVIRVPQDQVNYAYLAERRLPSARANFRQLIEDIAGSAPHATVTQSTQSFLAHARPAEHQFPSFDDFKQYTLWQLLVRWHTRSQFEGASGVEP